MNGETLFGMRSDDVAILFIAALAAMVLIVWLVFRSMADVMKTRQIQQTRREIAAYVAEGSISPEDAVRILSTDSSDLERQIGTAVAWGTLSAKRAAELLKTAREGRDSPDKVESKS